MAGGAGGWGTLEESLQSHAIGPPRPEDKCHVGLASGSLRRLRVDEFTYYLIMNRSALNYREVRVT